MLIRVLGPLAIAALCAVNLLQIFSPNKPRLIYNPSPSAPIGWYKLSENQSPQKGDLVAAIIPIAAQKLVIERQYLPPNIPILKTIWAVSGDEICHNNGQVLSRNMPALRVQSEDSLGRKLPSLSGCYIIPVGEVFLVSTDIQTSFDSRYFGPVPISNIIGRAEYLGQFQWGIERRKAGRG